jgi:hypothetical protein
MVLKGHGRCGVYYKRPAVASLPHAASPSWQSFEQKTTHATFAFFLFFSAGSVGQHKPYHSSSCSEAPQFPTNQFAFGKRSAFTFTLMISNDQYATSNPVRTQGAGDDRAATHLTSNVAPFAIYIRKQAQLMLDIRIILQSPWIIRRGE